MTVLGISHATVVTNMCVRVGRVQTPVRGRVHSCGQLAGFVCVAERGVEAQVSREQRLTFTGDRVTRVHGLLVSL